MKRITTFDESLADSTIAMSTYNLVVKLGRCTFGELYRVVAALAHPGISSDRVLLAISFLKARKLIKESTAMVGETVYSSTMPELGVVVSRDRSDMKIDPVRGIAIGGWKCWMASDNRGRLRAITAAEGK